MDKIIIIDFGSQYNMLISRRIREMNVYSEVVSYKDKIEFDKDIKGIILSGGPNSVYDLNSPKLHPSILELNLPILGICYGMQILIKTFGGKVVKGEVREYGRNKINIINDSSLTCGMSKTSSVWMSHSDHTEEMPESFELLAKSDYAIAIVKHKNKDIYGVQFHPEVTHTFEGEKLLNNFVFNVCHAQANWNIKNFIDSKVEEIKAIVKDESVILGLSGGVDSTVAAALLSKAINKQLVCIFVDTGLLRKNEALEVIKNYEIYKDVKIIKVDAKNEFYNALKGIEEPEEKRKIIGRVFFEVFEKEKAKHKSAKFLAQGTIYPDVIESISISGPSHTIKSHHNVGGMPKQETFEILEPLKELFKDEVRKVGYTLGLDENLINRHPFPGPGLGIRIIGEITEEKVSILQEADQIFINALKRYDLYDKVSQAFAVLLPVKTVGVMGDMRTYENVLAIRSVNSTDFMTAEFSRLPYEFLDEVSTEIINKVKGINRVVYDITSKPPGTIEWE
jgi:GMP synthase (glutamine-hydrolysing)